MQLKRLSIKTTAVCNGKCWWCGVQDWMEQNKGYHQSIENIEKFIEYSKDAGYKWNDIVYSGGEPFLWKHLDEATHLLKSSGIVGKIITYTNGFWMKDREQIAKRISEFDSVILSVYPFNQDKVALSRGLVGVANRPEFFVHPNKNYPDLIPAICNCRAYGMVGDVITLCPSMHFVAAGCNLEFEDSEWTTLQPNFLDHIDDSNVVNREICSWCFGNTRIHKHLEKIPNKLENSNGNSCVDYRQCSL